MQLSSPSPFHNLPIAAYQKNRRSSYRWRPKSHQPDSISTRTSHLLRARASVPGAPRVQRQRCCVVFAHEEVEDAGGVPDPSPPRSSTPINVDAPIQRRTLGPDTGASYKSISWNSEDEGLFEEESSRSRLAMMRDDVRDFELSPWLAVSLILAVAGIAFYYSEFQQEKGNQHISPMLMGASVLGLTTSKIIGGGGAMSAVGATWKASGAAGVISFYIRSLFSGKHLRIVKYIDEDSVGMSGDWGSIRNRMKTVTVRSVSARRLRSKIAKANEVLSREVALYHWIPPGFFESIPEDGDLTLIPENGFIVWTRPEVEVPLQGPLVLTPSPQKVELVKEHARALLLREIAEGPWKGHQEHTLISMALQEESKLLALHSAFGGGRDPHRFISYVNELVTDENERNIDSTHDFL